MEQKLCQLLIDASDLNSQKTFNIGNGQISLAIDGNVLIPGNTITANVSFEDSWRIIDYAGNSKDFSQTDLNIPGKLTNIQIGNPGDGVQIDLDKDALESMSSNDTSRTSFIIEDDTIVTAQLQDMQMERQ